MSNAFTDLMVARKIEKLQGELSATYATNAGLPSAVAVQAAVYSKSADALARSQAMAFAAVPQPLSRWRTKLATDPANAKIVAMGDSTSDPAQDAVEIWDRMKEYHTLAGQGLAGMNPANIVSYGHNGTKLADWWASGASKAEITGSGAHLVVCSFGLNDFRLGLTTQAAFRALLIQVVDYLRGMMPTTDIVLRIPNSLTSDNVHGWSVGWVSPATPEASQKYSTEMRNAYLSLIDYWPSGVAVWDAQGRIFGVTAKPFAETDGLLKDILHPSAAKGYPAIADGLVEDLIGLNAVPARTATTAVKPFQDIMGRADNAASAGVATTGQAYVTTIGAFGVAAHQLYNPNASLSRTTVNTGASNGEFGVTIAVSGTTLAWGFRYNDPANFLYITHSGSSGKYELYKKVADAITLIATYSTNTPANGDKLMVKADGALVKVYINGVLMGSYDFPQNVNGTWVSLQANNSTPRFTDLYATPY